MHTSSVSLQPFDGPAAYVQYVPLFVITATAVVVYNDVILYWTKKIGKVGLGQAAQHVRSYAAREGE